MIKITLPDGSIKEVESGSSALDVAKSISHGLARNVLSAQFNGQTIEATTPLAEDGSLVLFTWDQEEGKKENERNIDREFCLNILNDWYKVPLEIKKEIGEDITQGDIIDLVKEYYKKE